MKPAPFTYHRPEAKREALEILARHGDGAKPLAGGQSLVPMLALRLTRFDHLVDLNRIDELQGVRSSNGEVVVGSMTRQATVERDASLASAVPLLARATPLIGHFQIRNRGTVGGSLAHGDPASEYPAVALALDARFEIEGLGGARSIRAEQFFLSTWTTALGSEELLTAVAFPVWEGRCGFAVEELARRYGDFALIGAVCAVRVGEDGSVDKAGVSMFGVGETPIRLSETESALIQMDAAELSGDSLAKLCSEGVRKLDPPGDVHASKAYRKRVAGVILGRAMERALTEARAHG